MTLVIFLMFFFSTRDKFQRYDSIPEKKHLLKPFLIVNQGIGMSV